jgi:hypothetical protein
VLSGSSHLVGCRLSGCCRRSLREVSKSQRNVEKCAGLCGIAWRRRRGREKIFRLPMTEIAPWLASGFTSHGRLQTNIIQNIRVTSMESSSAANCLPQLSNPDIPAAGENNSSETALDRPISWLEGRGYHIKCVPEDPHYRLDPCSQYSYIAIVPGQPLTRSL